MANVDYTVGKQTAELLGNMTVKVENVVDFSVVNLAAADTAQVLDIPAGALVSQVQAVVRTAEGDTTAIHIGDDADQNGWNDSVDLGSAGESHAAPGTDQYASDGGKFYASADTIDVEASTEVIIDTAVVIFTAIYTILEESQT